jgi:DNA-binding response OmpR family regulator
MRVLVVDDNVDAADSTALLLGIDGFEAHSVHGALAGFDDCLVKPVEPTTLGDFLRALR